MTVLQFSVREASNENRSLLFSEAWNDFGTKQCYSQFIANDETCTEFKQVHWTCNIYDFWEYLCYCPHTKLILFESKDAPLDKVCLCIKNTLSFSGTMPIWTFCKLVHILMLKNNVLHNFRSSKKVFFFLCF